MENLNYIHIARGGGGGHGGGGGGGGHSGGSFRSSSYRSNPNGTPVDQPPAYMFAVVAILVVAAALTVSYLNEIYAGWKQKRTSNKIAKAKGLDPAHMVGYANRIFTRFQKDWSTFDTDSMGEYVTPGYMKYVKMQLDILRQGGRVNTMTDIHIKRSGLVRSKYERGAMDKFSFMVKARATDILEQKKSCLIPKIKQLRS